MPARPLKPDSVHVWHVGLDDSAAPEVLSAAERRHAETLADPLRRRRQVATRSAVRVLLGEYTGRSPESLVFAATPDGKPFLADDPELAFNISHSRADLLVAVARGTTVGIDIEMTVLPAPLDAGRAVFSVEEQQFLNELTEPERSRWFFRLWTRKEALLKGLGRGFLADPKEFTVLTPEPVSGWYLHDLECFEGRAAALASTLPRAGIQQLAYPGGCFARATAREG